MSIQVFLQGKLRGIEDFLRTPAGDQLFAGRSAWIALLSEMLPRALLAELGLSRMLLGYSSSGQFLLVLPEESRQAADDFLGAARDGAARLSAGRLRLVWASTENLGDWSIVRRRLGEAMSRQVTLAFRPEPGDWLPHTSVAREEEAGSFRSLAAGLREARAAGWDPAEPGAVQIDAGRHSWPLGGSADGIGLARHSAPNDDGSTAAGADAFAQRAEGAPLWGVLRGDVDGIAGRFRRLGTIEEHVTLSVLYKQFFAGELEVACSMPEFWRKVSILYCGGDDFAACGSWDALLLLAREIERLFHRFADANLRDLPGPEGKTISMALALGPPSTSLGALFEEAGRRLESAKSSAKDSFHVFGRTVEWKQFGHAGELKDGMMRLIRDFGCSPQFLGELEGFYREREPARVHDRPWRYHRRFNTVVGRPPDQQFQKLRLRLITELIGRNPAQVKLRPAGRVAAAWAKLSVDV